MTRSQTATVIVTLLAAFSALDAQDVGDQADSGAPTPTSRTVEQISSAEVEAGSYIIGVEDVLNIVTWEEPALSMPVTVRSDGWITLPLVNEIKVAGLTPSEVRDRIIERMKAYIREPSVSVIVQEINHFRVYFLELLLLPHPHLILNS